MWRTVAETADWLRQKLDDKDLAGYVVVKAAVAAYLIMLAEDSARFDESVTVLLYGKELFEENYEDVVKIKVKNRIFKLVFDTHNIQVTKIHATEETPNE